MPRERLDLPFLAQRTASPYLVGPNGYYLRDRATRKPLVWDLASGSARAARQRRASHEALEGSYEVDAIEIGPDDEVLAEGLLARRDRLRPAGRAHAAPTRPSGRQGDLRRAGRDDAPHRATNTSTTPASARRSRSTARRCPYRPVAVTLGKTVNNGWGGFECCWARTLLAALVGALEVPGGTLGTTVRLTRPMSRAARERASPDPTASCTTR